MTQSNPHWRATRPQPIEKASISFGPAPNSHVVYASPRARVVWRPHDCSAATPRRTLSIFHKDLVLTSLQIESLAKFLEKTSELVGQDSRPRTATAPASRTSSSAVCTEA